MSQRISKKSQSSASKDAVDPVYPYQNLEMENDDVERIGEVFIVRSETELTSLLHHWALGVRFCDNSDWVLIEGDNVHGRLMSSYCFFKGDNLPKIYEFFKLDKFAPQLQELDGAQLIASVASVTTFFKAMSTRTLDKVKVSPMQLRAIAKNIKSEPYVLGISDCHSWFLIALSKMEAYKVIKKQTVTEEVTNAKADAVGPLTTIFLMLLLAGFAFLRW